MDAAIDGALGAFRSKLLQWRGLSSHHVYRWYKPKPFPVMAGLWHCFTHSSLLYIRVFLISLASLNRCFSPFSHGSTPFPHSSLLPVWYHDFLREGWSQSVQDMYCQALTDLGVFPKWGFPLRNHQFLIGVSIINHPAIRVTPSMETPKNAHLIIFYHVLWFSMLNHGAWFRVQICQWCW